MSSPCRMETASGFSPLGLVMPHCGMSCLALSSPIKKLNQHLFARAGRCRGMTSRCTVPDRQVLPVFLVSKAILLTKKRAHMDENDACTHLFWTVD